jgi:hypothetical protein
VIQMSTEALVEYCPDVVHKYMILKHSPDTENEMQIA